MTHSLEAVSVWSLVRDASLVVQAVMLALLLASLVSWYVIARRGASVARAERALRDYEACLRESETPAGSPASRALAGGIDRVFGPGYREFAHLRRAAGIAPAAVLDGVDRVLQVSIAEQEAALERGLPLLATIGSVSPYVGLFGTVWGIMNAFIGLSAEQQVTLATVAPGIAEALVATAIGLFAAIPAVIAYNRISARTQRLVAGYMRCANAMQANMYRSMHAGPGPAHA